MAPYTVSDIHGMQPYHPFARMNLGKAQAFLGQKPGVDGAMVNVYEKKHLQRKVWLESDGECNHDNLESEKGEPCPWGLSAIPAVDDINLRRGPEAVHWGPEENEAVDFRTPESYEKEMSDLVREAATGVRKAKERQGKLDKSHPLNLAMNKMQEKTMTLANMAEAMAEVYRGITDYLLEDPSHEMTPELTRANEILETMKHKQEKYTARLMHIEDSTPYVQSWRFGYMPFQDIVKDPNYVD